MQVHLVGKDRELHQRLVPLLKEEGLAVSRGKLRDRRALVIVGPDDPHPLAVAQRVHRRAPRAHVLLVVADARHDAVRAEMVLTPGLGKDLEILSASEANQARLHRFVHMAVAAHQARARIDQANDFLDRVRKLI